MEGRRLRSKRRKGGVLVKKKILVPDYKLYKFDRETKCFIESKDNDFSNILQIGTKRSKKTSKFHLRKRDHFDYFKKYDLITLKKIYADRYFLDKKKNEDVVLNTIDFDGFITKKERTIIIEIKEKTPIKPKTKKPKAMKMAAAKKAVLSKFGCKTVTELRKNKNFTMSMTGETIALESKADWMKLYRRWIGEPPSYKEIDNNQLWSYGWDTRRLLWYSEVQNKTGFEILYIVRQIETREERKFIQWDYIFLNNFLKGVSWSNSGGGGGGGDTLTVPYSHFKNLKEVLL